MEIIENITSDQFFTIFWICYLFFLIVEIIQSIINFINERAWLVNDYEKIIAKNLNTYDVIDNKEKKLIAQAKEKIEKRELRRQKLNKLFKKGKK